MRKPIETIVGDMFVRLLAVAMMLSAIVGPYALVSRVRSVMDTSQAYRKARKERDQNQIADTSKKLKDEARELPWDAGYALIRIVFFLAGLVIFVASLRLWERVE